MREVINKISAASSEIKEVIVEPNLIKKSEAAPEKTIYSEAA
jgi:hypothetical protein